MSFNVKMNRAPLGNAWNLFSASAFDGSSDPGVPQAEDGDNDMPPIESSDGSENLDELSSNEGADQSIGSSSADVDPARTRALDGNDRRTK
jgi:hypothetical protein